MKVKVVIVAAGMGRRMAMSTSKQLIHIGGLPILYHTLLVFERMEEIDGIILVVKEDEATYIKKEIIEKHHMTKVEALTYGGIERSDSVKKGLDQVTDAEIVLIHDGARPFVSREAVKRLIVSAQNNGAAILAVPSKDTIKEGKGNIVSHTYDRSKLWMVQTPQAFRLEDIKEAFEGAHHLKGTIYDDSMLIEEVLNKDVSIVEGDYTNIKITTPSDLVIGEALYKSFNSL